MKIAGKQLVVLSVNGKDFGIDINSVYEIIRPSEIVKVPHSLKFIDGLINLRNEIYAVINLRKRFAFPFIEYDNNTKIILVKVGNDIIGLAADMVKEISVLGGEYSEISPKTQDNAENKFVESIAKSEDHVILLLDIEKICQIK